MFSGLHHDLFPDIFDYLSQQELLNILLLDKQFYQQITKYQLFEVKNERDLRKACRLNYIISIRRFIAKNTYKKYVDIVAIKAYQYGHQNLIDFIRKNKKFDVNSGLYGASRGGHIEIVRELLKSGAGKLNNALYGACKGGNQNIVELLIQLGARKLNLGLQGACYGGYIHIFEYMEKLGANKFFDGIIFAFKGGNVDMVKYLYATFGTMSRPMFMSACICKHWHFRHLNILKWLIDNGFIAPGSINGYQLYEAYQYGSDDVINYVHSFGSFNDLQTLLYLASNNERKDIIKKIFTYAKFDKGLDEGLSVVCKYEIPYLIKYFIEEGAKYCSNCNKNAKDHIIEKNKKRKHSQIVA